MKARSTAVVADVERVAREASRPMPRRRCPELVTSAGRSTATQCQKPDGVGASGSKQVTTKLLVPSGAPLQDSCGDVLPQVGDLRVVEGCAVGDIGAGDGEAATARELGVGVFGDRAIKAHGSIFACGLDPSSETGQVPSGRRGPTVVP